jgi:hypothetical protein
LQNVFLMATDVAWWREMSMHHIAPVSLACYVVYSAGLHLEVKGILNW